MALLISLLLSAFIRSLGAINGGGAWRLAARWTSGRGLDTVAQAPGVLHRLWLQMTSPHHVNDASRWYGLASLILDGGRKWRRGGHLCFGWC